MLYQVFNNNHHIYLSYQPIISIYHIYLLHLSIISIYHINLSYLYLSIHHFHLSIYPSIISIYLSIYPSIIPIYRSIYLSYLSCPFFYHIYNLYSSGNVRTFSELSEKEQANLVRARLKTYSHRVYRYGSG